MSVKKHVTKVVVITLLLGAVYGGVSYFNKCEECLKCLKYGAGGCGVGVLIYAVWSMVEELLADIGIK